MYIIAYGSIVLGINCRQRRHFPVFDIPVANKSRRHPWDRPSGKWLLLGWRHFQMLILSLRYCYRFFRIARYNGDQQSSLWTCLIWKHASKNKTLAWAKLMNWCRPWRAWWWTDTYRHLIIISGHISYGNNVRVNTILYWFILPSKIQMLADGLAPTLTTGVTRFLEGAYAMTIMFIWY